MKKKGRTLFCLIVLISTLSGEVSATPFVTKVEELDRPEFADWITHPMAAGNGAGVYLFRKSFDLRSVAGPFIVHISADNRYVLFINGHEVGFGPAASDLSRWQYDTYDLAHQLEQGRNTIAVKIWNGGPHSPERQVSAQTGLVVSGPAIDGQLLKTDDTWRVTQDPSYSLLEMSSDIAGGGYIAGHTERVDARIHPWGWQSPGFTENDSWVPARVIGKATHGQLDTWGETPWALSPRSIPFMEQLTESPDEFRVRRISSGAPADADFEGNEALSLPFTFPANTTTTLLLDRGHVTLGFPHFDFEGGENTLIRTRYQEALFRQDGSKGHRDQVENKIMKGIYDEYLHDGESRSYSTLWVRSFRYLEITVEAGEQPLVMTGLGHRSTAYPFELRGHFRTDQPLSNDFDLDAIWEASWRTLRLNALETYMDCPYYEQVQYIGDTRIQSLISLYLAGDSRLMRNAVLSFDQSRQPNGLTKSNHPSANTQIIPPFALLYVLYVHDYLMHVDDTALVERLLPGIRFTLDWFMRRVGPDGLMGPLPYWNHVDGGAEGYPHGSPPNASSGGSIHMTLLTAYTLGKAAEIFGFFGKVHERDDFLAHRGSLLHAARNHGFDEQRGWYAESSDKFLFTQHTNAFALLNNMIEPERRAEFAERLVQDASLSQGTLYFQYYVFEALHAAGRADLIIPQLARWQEMLDRGLTTFPEHGVESRSDAHAWAAHPMLHLLQSTAGIRSASPGFRTVQIEPVLGDLKQLDVKVIHPQGAISLRLDPSENGRQFHIGLPGTVTGNFTWQGKQYSLAPGMNTLSFPE